MPQSDAGQPPKMQATPQTFALLLVLLVACVAVAIFTNGAFRGKVFIAAGADVLMMLILAGRVLRGR